MCFVALSSKDVNLLETGPGYTCYCSHGQHWGCNLSQCACVRSQFGESHSVALGHVTSGSAKLYAAKSSHRFIDMHGFFAN